MPVTLHGYRYSVYTRIARLALREKSVPFQEVEVDPFADPPPAELLALHPFGRVPVLRDAGFAIYETAAITRYIDTTFAGPVLTPDGAQAVARMAQVIAIADNYGYWPLVRQVFSHRVFRPATGETGDPAQIARGLAASARVLDALEAIAAEHLVLNRTRLTLADIHLAPIIGYFVMAPEGAAALCERPALTAWWQWVRQRDSFIGTDPGLPD
jgi:glutathione S-transferase